MRGSRRESLEAGGEARRAVEKRPGKPSRLFAEWYTPAPSRKGQPLRRLRRRKYCGLEGDPAAEAKCAELIERMRLKPEAQDYTVESWARKWVGDLAEHTAKGTADPNQAPDEEGFSPRTIKNYKWVIEKRLAGTALGRMPIGKAVAKDIVGWALELLQVRIAMNSLVHMYLPPILGAFSSAAGIYNLIPYDPTDKILLQIRKAAGRRVRRKIQAKSLHFHEWYALTKAMEESVDAPKPGRRRRRGGQQAQNPRPSWYSLLDVCLGTRISETYGLMWTDFTKDYRFIHVRRQVSDGEIRRVKSETSKRPLAVPETLRQEAPLERQRQREAALREGKTPSRFVLGVEPENAEQSKQNLRRAMRRAAKKAGLDTLPFKVTPHTLRHTFGAGLRKRGVDIHDVKTAMGHTAIDTTEIYTVPRSEDAPPPTGPVIDGAIAEVAALFAEKEGTTDK